MNNLFGMISQMAMQRMGGPQNFQQQMNQMQQEAQKLGMTPQQYAMYKIQNGAVSQQDFDSVMNGINSYNNPNGRR